MPFRISVVEELQAGDAPAKEITRLEQRVDVLDLHAIFLAVNKKPRKPRAPKQPKSEPSH